jgi:hypothetical protein
MHWKRGPRGATLLPGDALQVVSDRRHVTFMYSYPNFMPMKPSAVRHMQALLREYDFDDVLALPGTATSSRRARGGGCVVRPLPAGR